MRKNIEKELTKALKAIENADILNEARVEPDSPLRNHLITIEEILKEILYKGEN